MVVCVAIGHETNTEIFRNQIELDNKGYMKKYEGSRPALKACQIL
jgi:thioredoxin reductase